MRHLADLGLLLASRRTVAVVTLVAAIGTLCGASPVLAGTVTMTSCSTYGDNGADTDVNGSVWTYSSNGGFTLAPQCAPGSGFEINPNNSNPVKGNHASWLTVVPSSMQIIAWFTADPSGSASYDHGVLIDPNASADGYSMSFFSNSGMAMYPGPNCCGSGLNQMAYAESNAGTNAGFGGFLSGSPWFGWQVTCQVSTCNGYPYSVLSVHGVTLVASDNQPPTITPVGSSNVLNYASRWIRGGNWSASFSASDDSGVCVIEEKIGSQTIQPQVDWSPNAHSWTQCWSSASLNQILDTTQYPNGTLPVTYVASDAASPANQASPSVNLQIDNAPVGLTMTGPSDVSSTAGTPYITATATAGPSGVAGISCSVDGGPYQWHPVASVQLPVSGLGTHSATCVASNNAIDTYGRVATSAPATFTMSIRDPMVMGAWTRTERNAPDCHYGVVRSRTRGRWVTIHVHGRPVWVYRRGHVIKRRKLICRLRTVLRRTVVWRTVIRHGHKVKVASVRYVRTVLPPQQVNSSVTTTEFGRGTELEGWLGTSGFVSAGAQPVDIVAAPDNGSGAFTTVATTLTNADGSWSVALPPGPSRIAEAVFPGSATLESATSNQVSVRVPADVVLRIHPRHTHWGSTIRISGRLLGGYIPPSGELVLLRIGWPGGSTEIGHVMTDSSGRFSAPYTFLRGAGTEHYWIWAQSARESDYPFTPAQSQRIPIVVTQK